MALLCRLLGHDQNSSLCPSVCNSGHNDTAPCYYPRARPIISMRDGLATSDAIFLSHPDGAMLHPCHLQGVCLPVDFHVSAQRNFQRTYLVITPLLPCLPLHHAASCSLRVTCTPAPKPPYLDGVKSPCSMQRQFFRDDPWGIINAHPLWPCFVVISNFRAQAAPLPLSLGPGRSLLKGRALAVPLSRFDFV
jgi:hypothetical protein